VENASMSTLEQAIAEIGYSVPKKGVLLTVKFIAFHHQIISGIVKMLGMYFTGSTVHLDHGGIISSLAGRMDQDIN
jgi:hypothetical protein